MTALDHFQINDIVFNHYWYEQTNIDFYRVTKVTKKFITLEAIDSMVTKYHESGDVEVVPDPDTAPHQTEQNGRHGIRIHDDAVFVNFQHGGGYKWDGKPKWVSYGR